MRYRRTYIWIFLSVLAVSSLVSIFELHKLAISSLLEFALDVFIVCVNGTLFLLSYRKSYGQRDIYSDFGSNSSTMAAMPLLRLKTLKNRVRLIGISPIISDDLKLSKARYPKSTKDLQIGYINYQANDKMKVGVIDEVLAEVFINEVFLNDIKEKKNVDQIRLTRKVRAMLTSKDNKFEIEERSSETQLILEDDKTHWYWYVKPVKSGQGILELVLSVAIEDEQFGIEMKDLETYRKEIAIQINPMYSTKHFFIVNWQWLIASIFGSGVLFAILKAIGWIK